MYTANSNIELKRLIRKNNFPILVTDKKVIKTVQWMESRKQHAGAVGAAIKPGIVGAISEPTIIALAVIAMITLLGLYALYKDKDIEVERKTGGGMVLRTKS